MQLCHAFLFGKCWIYIFGRKVAERSVVLMVTCMQLRVTLWKFQREQQVEHHSGCSLHNKTGVFRNIWIGFIVIYYIDKPLSAQTFLKMQAYNWTAFVFTTLFAYYCSTFIYNFICYTMKFIVSRTAPRFSILSSALLLPLKIIHI